MKDVNSKCEIDSPKDSIALKFTIEDLEKKFANTPLENYVPAVFRFWQAEPFSRVAHNVFVDSRERLQSYLRGCLQLSEMILSFKKGDFSGKGWRLTEAIEQSRLITSSEEFLFERLKGFDAIFQMHHPEDPPDGSVIGSWGRMLRPFPRLRELKRSNVATKERYYYDSIGVSLFTIKEMEDIVQRCKECVRISKDFAVPDEESVASRFVAYMLENGIQRNRKTYRELYRVLELYDCIPDYIKTSHAKTSSADPQSNYIKSYVTTIVKIRNRDEQDFNNTNP